MAILQARGWDEEAKFVKMSGEFKARDVVSRQSELRVPEAERRIKLTEERVRSLVVDIVDGFRKVRDLELNAVGLRADVQRIFAKERERIRMDFG